MKTVFHTVILALISITLSYSQTSLEGKVTDIATGERILFGTVALYKNDVLITGVETDLEGNYFFSAIDPGTYDVEASYIGYTPKKYVDVIIKEGRLNRLDFAISEGVLMDAVEIVEYKVPLVEIDMTTSGSTITADELRSLPTKKIKAVATPASGITTGSSGDLSIRGSRSSASLLYTTAGIRMHDSSLPSTIAFDRSTLPKSGQMTAGEWNDLHNWKDWLTLMDDENYSIMTERFEIFPTSRYNVIVVNESNAVMVNVLVQLLDNDDNVIWETYTDNSGKAELWESVFEKDQDGSSIKVKNQVNTEILKIEDGSNTFVLSEECFSPDQMDIVFAVDATSSMNDEITYLKSELLDVIDRIKTTNKAIDFNLGSVFYRDTKDEYLTRVSPLSPNIEQTVNFVGNQNSSGGGDGPEAVEAALEETLNLNWRKDALKLVFLILDAPPHEDDPTMEKIRTQIKEAASRGIKIIPVTASGIGRETEFLMKFMAILTNGTYVFITDDSGIGNPHLDPVIDEYEIEKLNDCLVRLITQYSKSYSCDVDFEDLASDLDVNVYPNPATQFITVKTNNIPDKIKIYSANGMMVKSISPTEKITRIELSDFVNGIYTVSIILGKNIESRQIILLK